MTAANGVSPGLRDRLLDRQRPVLAVSLLIDDDTQARRDVALAEEAFRVAHLRGEDDREKAVRAARREVDKTIKALDGCFATVTVRAMPPEEFEALIAAHPPEQGKDGGDAGEAWSDVTFPRAAFLACVDGDMSRAEWEKFLDTQCSQAERLQLYNAALSVNVRAPSYAVPKG